MYIQGPSSLHASQPVRAPHKGTSTEAGEASALFSGADELDISSEADFISQVRDLPDIRQDRVASLKAQIQSGAYDSDAKIEAALDRFLDEFEG